MKPNQSIYPFSSYFSDPYPCSYLSSQQARSQVIVPVQLIDTAHYSRLIQQGFRRSGVYVYRPACTSCRACIPIRIPVAAFASSRTQKKIRNRLSAALNWQKVDAKATMEGFKLYQRYQQRRHADGEMLHDGQQEYEALLADSYVHTEIVEMRQSESGALKMVLIQDVLADGVSSVYTFFEPSEPRFSYGVFGILWQLEYARSKGLPYLYLGYWIQKSAKMSYKNQFHPYELFIDGAWQCGI